MCPDEGFSEDFWGIEFQQEKSKELYILTPACCELAPSQTRAWRIFTCISRDRIIFLWPVKLPADGDTKFRRWSESALEIAEEAKQLWVGRWPATCT